jgi:hypothetical protein
MFIQEEKLFYVRIGLGKKKKVLYLLDTRKVTTETKNITLDGIFQNSRGVVINFSSV